MQHIRQAKLPLVFSKLTRADGNCWYDAVVDQVVQHAIPDKPQHHLNLRSAVCDAMVSFPEAEEWTEDLFGGSWAAFLDFVAANSRPTTWTDNSGIMVQATAIYLERNIRLVGTINAGESVSWTTVEARAGAGAELFPPLYIGYYQSQHYQSLQLVPGSASLPGPAQLSPNPPRQDTNNNPATAVMSPSNDVSVSVQSSLSPLPPAPPRTPVRRRRAATPRSPPSQRVQPRRSQRKKTFSAIALSALTALSLYRPPPPTLVPSQSGSPAPAQLGTPPHTSSHPNWPVTPPNFLWSDPPLSSPVPLPSSPNPPFDILQAAGIVIPADPHHYNLEERDFLAWGYHEIKDQTGWYKSLSKSFLDKYPSRRRPPTPVGIKYIYNKLRKHKQLKDLPRCGRPTHLTDDKLAEMAEEMDVDLHKPARY